jgi:proline iminopeptidase
LDRRDFVALGLAGLYEASTGLDSAGYASATTAAPPPTIRPRDRAEATTIVANARRIVSPGGIEKLQAINIGGIQQWVSIRGADKRNPILLLIHGGPGYMSMPMSWWFTRGWEEYFTVVQWDQRGAGKTFLLNDPAKVAATMTREQVLADAVEMVHWVSQELGQKKIFVIGHSWGSYLGLQLAAHHPELLHAYVGVGQLTDGPESERRGWAFALHAAQADGNQKAVRELQGIAPYFEPGQPSTLEDIYKQRKWLDFYGGVMVHRKGNSDESDLTFLSPDYSDAEIARIWEGNDFSERRLLQSALSLDLTDIRRLECPLLIFAGRYDVNVNSEVAAKWFSTVSAPAKQLIWFEQSAHLPMTEEPGKFLVSLVQHARPLAVMG